MPEGDTLRKLSRALGPRLLGRQVRITRLRGAPTHARLPSGRVEAVEALGKHLLIRIAGTDGRGQVLRTHLGLWGGWHQYAPAESWRKPARQAWVVMEAAGAVFVCFNAQAVEVMRADGVRGQVLRARLGPDLLAEDTDIAPLPARAREILTADAPLTDVLLDQRVAAGIGNEYKSELLFLAGLSPHRTLGSVDDETLVSLFALARDLLLRNLG